MISSTSAYKHHVDTASSANPELQEQLYTTAVNARSSAAVHASDGYKIPAALASAAAKFAEKTDLVQSAPSAGCLLMTMQAMLSACISYLQMLSVQDHLQNSHMRHKRVTTTTPVNGFALNALLSLAPLLHSCWQLIQR